MTKCYSHGKFYSRGIRGFIRCRGIGHTTKMGQSLEFEPNDSKTLNWESWDSKNKLWFNATLDIMDFSISNSSERYCLRLAQILKPFGSKNNFLMKTEEQ